MKQANIEFLKYSAIFILFTLFFTGYFFTYMNGAYSNISFELSIISLILISGLITLYYSMHNKYEDLYKLGFIIILIFGLFFVFLNPVLMTPDEMEHYARSELISEGVIIPHFTPGEGYNIHQSFYQILYDYGNNFFQTSHSNTNFNNTVTHYNSVFAHNPFFAYLISALGIIITKFLGLNVISSLYLGRIFNLIIYALICSYAIKKAPKYKIPLLVVATLPLSLSQAGSFSIDSLINAFSILSVALIINMYKSEKVENKTVLLFFILTSLTGIMKVTNFLFLFLIYLIPKEKFNENKYYKISRILPIILSIFILLYCQFYSSPKYLLSYRLGNIKMWGVNTTEQISFMSSHPIDTFNLFTTLPLDSWRLVVLFFHFYHTVWSSFETPLFLISGMYLIFFIIVSLFTSDSLNLKLKDRIKVLLIVILTYYGTYLLQYLSWTSVGSMRIMGVNSRYFIPLLFLIPLILNIGKVKLKDYKLILTFILIFISGTLIMILSSFY